LKKEKDFTADYDDIKGNCLLKWHKQMLRLLENPEKYRKYTPEETDKKLKELKIGKYREWSLDVKRFNEIVEQCSETISNRAIQNGVNYYRSNYEDAQFMSDEEIIESGLYKVFYKDRQATHVERRKEERETINYYKDIIQ
jgi:vacuolar-type H+-ATPase subunit C/Vma6